MQRIIEILQISIVISFTWTCTKGQNPECPYLFTSLPPEDIVCNPYHNRRLQLGCAVTGSALDDIKWYFSPSNTMSTDADDTVVISESSKYSFIKNIKEDILSVGLIINNLNEENDTGTYWCHAFLRDGTTLHPQSSFLLQTSDMYAPDYRCPNDSLQRSNVICADISGPTPETSTTPSPSVSSASIRVDSRTVNTSITGVMKTRTVDMTTSMPTEAASQFVVLYIIIALVGFLLIVCFVLFLVIFLLCSKRHSEKADHMIGFINSSKNGEGSLKRINFSVSPSDSLIHDSVMKGGSGDYAEIGPALITSMHLHTLGANEPHYSEINDPASQHTPRSVPEISASQDEQHPCSNNPYDLPILTADYLQDHPTATVTSEVSMLSHNYSRLERMVTDTIDSEGTSTPSQAIGPHIYHILESSLNEPTSNISPDLPSDVSDSQTEGLQSKAQLPTIPEHPYHILEEQSESSLTQEAEEPEESGEKINPSKSVSNEESENYGYDRLVDPQIYNVLTHSMNNPVICVQDTSYSHLEREVTDDLKVGRKNVTALECPAEIFDDIQYVTSPLLVNEGVEKVAGRNGMHEALVLAGDEGKGRNLSKYYGDYERDPAYMQRLKLNSSGGIGKSMSLPNIYQPLELTTMDPVQVYEKYKHSRSQPSGY